MKKKSKLVIAFAVLIAIVIVVFASTRIIGESAKVYAQHIEVSQKYLDELEYDLAIAELEKAIELEPKKTEAYIALAEIYMMQENYTAAEELLQQAIAIMEEAGLEEEGEQIAVQQEKLAEAVAIWSEQTTVEEAESQVEVPSIEETVVESTLSLAREEKIELENEKYRIDEYNDAGLLVKQTHYGGDDKIEGWISFEYNANGKLIKKLMYSGDSNVAGYWIEYEYNADGYLVTETNYMVDGTKEIWYSYEYDENGNLIKETNVHAYGRSEKEYDVNGNLIAERDYGEDGEIYIEFIYEYDESGKLIRKIDNIPSWDGKLSWFTYEYDADGNLVCERSFWDTKFEYVLNEELNTIEAIATKSEEGFVVWIKEYDVKGNMVKHISYVDGEEGGSVLYEEPLVTTYEYDENGNCLNIVKYNSDGTIQE